VAVPVDAPGLQVIGVGVNESTHIGSVVIVLVVMVAPSRGEGHGILMAIRASKKALTPASSQFRAFCATVGVTGFEPAAFRSQSGRATKLRHTPSLAHTGIPTEGQPRWLRRVRPLG
jgi:hypothetical protein